MFPLLWCPTRNKKKRATLKRPLSPRDTSSLWTEKMFSTTADCLTPHNPHSIDSLSLSTFSPSTLFSPPYLVPTSANGTFPGIPPTFASSSLPPIRNSVMPLILLRLQEGIFSGTWDLRVTCLEAMAKISFLSEFEVKLHLFEFFSWVLKENGLGLSTEVLPIIEILFDIFEAFEAHAEGTPISEETRKNIQQRVRRYCIVPATWSPLSAPETPTS
eukprot:TRINITY_DN649_c0_g2_i1.p1 TRINITY_DN649_c0_g2~~TRINITY_DN649_c0_g2_i1.p1  ORF type:complete len:216 (-),score=33.13 TRINITY_DN649_c0_g2_i1:59-706(-)